MCAGQYGFCGKNDSQSPARTFQNVLSHGQNMLLLTFVAGMYTELLIGSESAQQSFFYKLYW